MISIVSELLRHFGASGLHQTRQRPPALWQGWHNRLEQASAEALERNLEKARAGLPILKSQCF
jgi:hypothetical protein